MSYQNFIDGKLNIIREYMSCSVILFLLFVQIAHASLPLRSSDPSPTMFIYDSMNTVTASKAQESSSVLRQVWNIETKSEAHVNYTSNSDVYEGNSVLGNNPVNNLSLSDIYGITDYRVLPVSGQLFNRACHVDILNTATDAGNVELYTPVLVSIPQNSLLYLVFYARSTSSVDASFDIVFRNASIHNMESFHLKTSVNGDWTRFCYAFISKEEYKPEEAQVVFKLGYGIQSIEIGGLDVKQYGPSVLMEEPALSKFTGFGNTCQLISIRSGQPFGNQVLRITLDQPQENSWNAQCYPNPMIFPNLNVGSNDVFFVSFYARKISTSDGKWARLSNIVERYSDYQKPLSFGVMVDTNWHQYMVPFKAGMTIEPGDFRAALFTGYEPQVFEIAQMRWYYFGQLSDENILPTESFLDYDGHEPEAQWRLDAAERIEQYRKVDLEVEVQNAMGVPLPDAIVDINMTRHDYGFGMAASYWLIDDQGPDGAAYREKLLEICNRITNHNCLKMPAWEGNWGEV